MKPKTMIIFAISVAVCTVAATYRFHDSAHVIGTIKKGGGKARHPARLDGKKDSASLIVTARVLPPYRGNARIALEGAPEYTYAIHNAEPAIRIPFHHRPSFGGDVYSDLQPNDKVALWVVMKKRGKPKESKARVAKDTEEPSCCIEASDPVADKFRSNGRLPGAKGPVVAFYDTKSNERLLTVPLELTLAGGDSHGR